MKKTVILFVLFVLNYSQIFAQLGIQYNSAQATNGYSLFTNYQATYLIDNCGKIVNQWNISNIENHGKLLPNGNLLYSKNNFIKEVDWDGNELRSVLVSQNSVSLDYEVVPMPNGNYMCVGRKPTEMSVFRQYGYQNQSSSFSIRDVIIEVDGITGEIVWEWDILDHVIQDKDATKNAYGIVKDNPRKLDINAIATYDWNQVESFMINGMDYNPELDEIAISVRKLSEVVIIDHSTTTLEAKGSSGGKHGHGGDAIYRYGNPQNYGRGKLTDRQLYFQHNPNWIMHGEHKGKIMVFNNNLSSNKGYSSVDIFEPVKNTDGSYRLDTDDSFKPIIPTKAYNKVTTQTDFESGYTSGGKVLPNGNISITVGRYGTLLEIDPSGKVLWEYSVPDAYYIFRTTRYPADYSAFVGKDLTPNGTVEFPSSTYNCLLVSTSNVLEKDNITLTQEGQKIIITGVSSSWQYKIYDISGSMIQHGSNNGVSTIDLNSNYLTGLYIIQISKDEGTISKKMYLH